MKNAKKIFFIFLSVNLIYCSFFNVEIVRANSDFETVQTRNLPVVHDLGFTYSVGGAVLGGGLSSQLVGGVSALVGSSGVVGALLTAGGIALAIGGAYVVGTGIYNVYEVAKDWAVTNDISGKVKTAFDEFGNMIIEHTPDLSLVSSLVSSLFSPVPYTSKKEYNFLISGVTHHFYNTPDNLKVVYRSSTNISNGMLAKSSDNVMVFDGNVKGHDTIIHAESIWFQPVSASKIKAGITSIPLYVLNGYYLDPVTDIWKSYAGTVDNIKIPVYCEDVSGSFLNLDIDMSVFSSFDVISSDNATAIRSLLNNQVLNSSSSTIPNTYISALNPSLRWNNKEKVWEDTSTGEVVDALDIAIPFPNKWTVEGGFSFDSELDNALGSSSGDSTIPDTDGGGTTLPQIDFSSILGFLQSILDWLIAFPSWLVTNLVNVITGAIATVSDCLGNIWSWCQDLPNVLSDVLAGIIEFLQSIGATLADVLAGIIALPFELVNALIDLVAYLVVPSDGFFENSFNSIFESFKGKFPILNQLVDFFSEINISDPGEPPSIKITLPEFFGGETYDFVDFTIFHQYRNYYLRIVRLFMWIFFLKSLFRKFPSVVSGGGTL